MIKQYFLSLLLLVLLSVSNAQVVGMHGLKFKKGERYSMECAISGSSAYFNPTQYPYQSRVWYLVSISDRLNERLFKCRVKITRLLEYKQSSLGYEVYDSKFPVALNKSDYRNKLIGYEFGGTINTQGKLAMDAQDYKASLKFHDMLWESLPSSIKGRSIQYDYFKSEVKSILFERHQILQLFYPTNNRSTWKPGSLRLQTGKTSDINQIFKAIQYITFIQKSPKHSFLKLVHKTRTDTVFVSRNGNLDGTINLSPLGRKHIFSFSKLSTDTATIHINYDAKRKFYFMEKLMLKSFFNFKEMVPGKGILQPVIEKPSIIKEHLTGAWVYIEPGETIHVMPANNSPVRFSGSLADENRYLNKFIGEHPFFNHDFNYSQEDLSDQTHFVGSVKDMLSKTYNELNADQSKINPKLYSLLYKSYKYSAASYYLRYLNVKHQGLDAQNAAGLITGDMLYDPDVMYISNGEYVRFIDDYFAILLRFGRGSHGFTVWNDSDENDIFELNYIPYAFGSFPHYITTGNALMKGSGLGKSDLIYHTKYEEFIKTYPDGGVGVIKFFYEIKASLAPGKIFPDFTATNLNNKKVSIKDLRGKKVMIHFVSEYQGNEKIFEPMIDSLNKLHSFYPGIDFVYVYDGHRADMWRKKAEKFPKGIHIWTAQENDSDLILFKEKLQEDRLQETFFMIDEKGAIFKTYVIPTNMMSERGLAIKEYLQPELKKFSNRQISLITPQLKRWGLTALVVVGLTVVCSYLVVKWQLKRIRLKDLEKKRIAEIELKAIRSQLNPHFLFNTMNSILCLINSGKKDSAAEYLSNLSVMMRAVLNNSESGTVSLAEEIEFIERYMLLEQLRFSFQYEVVISPNIDVYTTTVPAMFLQPYVENAIVHGISSKGDDGRLTIRVEEIESQILFTIEDNGPGFNAAESLTKKKSMGIKLMREKLKLIYREDFELRFTNSHTYSTGSCVQIKIPPFV